MLLNRFILKLEMFWQAAQVVTFNMSALSECVCVDGWFILHALITQCTTGVQLHPAPD